MTETMDATERPAAPSLAPLFLADRPEAPSLAAYPALDLFADLALHRQSQTPLTIGLFGGPGAGKTHALQTLARRAKGLAAKADADGPFLSQAVTVTVDARTLLPAASGLASALHTALLDEGPQSAAARLAHMALDAATDPQTAAQEASARLAEVRERFGTEHHRLEDLKERRAGLSESLLFGAAGTRLDDDIKRNRKRIEASLKTFGFAGDAIATYKELLREAAPRPARISAFADSLWAYAGQTRLLIFSVIFFALAWTLFTADQNGGAWLAEVRAAIDGAAEAAGWVEGHGKWFAHLSLAAVALGALCLLLNLWRALRFALPMARGLRLLEEDARAGKAELDRDIAAQSRLIAQLSDETQRVAAQLHSAETRARARSAEGARPFTPSASGAPGPDATAYLDAIAAGLGERGAPRRLIVLLDGLEALPAAQAAAVVDEAHHLLNRPGFALIIAADPQHLTAGWGGAAEAAQRFERYVQAPFNLRMIRGQQAGVAYAQQLLGATQPPEEKPVDADASALDAPVKVVESHLVSKLSSLAGDTPRAIKRYLNCWRLARPMTHDTGALALMLALDHGGDSGELAAMGAAMDLEEPGKTLEIHAGEPRLAAALASLNALRPSPLTNAQAHAAWLIARDYSLPTS